MRIIKFEDGVKSILTYLVIYYIHSRHMDNTIKHINKFATEGLRTMAVAVKTLSDAEYNTFAQALDNAKNSLQDRESKLRDVYEALESNLELIGAIGIEDRLQENVKDTLIAMSQAGIKVSTYGTVLATHQK